MIILSWDELIMVYRINSRVDNWEHPCSCSSPCLSRDQPRKWRTFWSWWRVRSWRSRKICRGRCFQLGRRQLWSRDCGPGTEPQFACWLEGWWRVEVCYWPSFRICYCRGCSSIIIIWNSYFIHILKGHEREYLRIFVMKCWKWKSWSLSHLTRVLTRRKCLAFRILWSCILMVLGTCICLTFFSLVNSAFDDWLAWLSFIFFFALLGMRACEDWALYLFLLLWLDLLAATVSMTRLALRTMRRGSLLLVLLSIWWSSSLLFLLSNIYIFSLWAWRWRPSSIVFRNLGKCLFFGWSWSSLLLINRLFLILLSILLFWFWLI